MSDVVLSIKNVKKNYYTKGKLEKEALKGVSMDIKRGEIFGLLGVNGAGKTTLSSIIATLHPPTAGDIHVNGVSIYDDLDTYRLQLGFCPQRPNLHPLLTLESNLRFAGRFYGMNESMIDKRLLELVPHFELGPYMHQRASVLSGGYKQRFMIARSLMHKPHIVVLDEPTVGLDPHIRRQLWQLIKNLKDEGITVILTTHYLDEAEELSDRVCILDQGVVKLIERPHKLLSDFNKANLEDVFVALMDENQIVC